MRGYSACEVMTNEERERLILEHLPQVRLIARRIQERLPESISLDDLISTGVLGLISAIDNFDPSQPSRLGLGAAAEASQGEANRSRDCDRRAATEEVPD
jgi:Sigma-70 region 2